MQERVGSSPTSGKNIELTRIEKKNYEKIGEITKKPMTKDILQSPVV